MFSLSQVDSSEKQIVLMNDALEKISTRLKQKSDQPAIVQGIEWITAVFEKAIQISDQEDLELEGPVSKAFPKDISAFTMQTVIRMLTSRSVLRDNGLYYLNDVGIALGLNPSEIENLLNKEFKLLQHEFTQQLIDELDSEQIYWCAFILMKIICADGHIHPAEKTFFEIIRALLNHSDDDIRSLEKKVLETDSVPKLSLPEKSAIIMMKYVITIAMCDGEYAGKESEFIKKAANALGIEESKIDSILQPIAASFMVMRSLF